jgi:hypothetical protein
MWKTGGTSNEDGIMNIQLINLRVTEDLLNGLESATEEVLTEFLEMRTCKGGIDVNTLKESVDFNTSLGGRGECMLGTFTCSEDVYTRNGTSVLGGLTWQVIEVCRGGNHSIVARGAEICLSGLLHLQVHHGPDFFWVLKNKTSQC